MAAAAAVPNREADETGEDEIDGTSDIEEKTNSGKKKVVKKRRLPQLTINLTNCKYDSVRRVAKKFGMKVVSEDEEWSIYWTDVELPEKLNEIKPYQKVNHFPGMSEICRKDLLARNMNRMLKLFPKDYNCFPRTWTLPADFGDLQAYFQKKKNKVFIAKPGSGSQGKGIFLFRNPKDVNKGEHLVCQQYIGRPFIIDGFKFDLRLYVLVTSCDPLRVYMYRDGLARFATVHYKEPTGNNMDEVFMHLTNYAINKLSKDFVRDDDCGSKRRVTTVNKWFVENGYDLDKIWGAINDVVIKTLISIHPILKHNYRSFFYNHTRGSACFEILGFDILLDRKLKAWLVEVNRSPSFHTDAPLDKEVKEGLLHDTLQLLDLYANTKRRCVEEEKKKAQDRLLCGKRSKESSAHEEERARYEAHFEKYERKHLGGFTRIYPKDGNEEVYKQFFDQSTSLCSQTASSRARSELAKQLREELEAKRKEQEKFLCKDRLSHQSKPEASGAESPPHNGEQKIRTVASQEEASKRLSSAGRAAVIRRRGFSFRVPDQSTDLEPTAPSGPGEVPQTILEEEELERLAGLQLRESLVRGMGVSEQVRVVLESQPNSRAATPSLPSSAVKTKSENTSAAITTGAGAPHYFTQTYIHHDTPEHYLPSSLGRLRGASSISRGITEYRLRQRRSAYLNDTPPPPPPPPPPPRVPTQWTMGPTNYKPHQILSDTSGNYIYGDKSHLQLQLCGSAIPPAPPRLKNRVGYKQSPSNARCSYYHPHSSTTQGLTINDRLRQLKFNLSAPPIGYHRN